jgi:hypothetical protein
MTQIQLPLLIREKIKDYLSFTEWRDKMIKVCIEYEKKYSYYEFYHHYKWLIYYRLPNEHKTKSYNYRHIHYPFFPTPRIYNKNGTIVAPLSPNYWSKNYPTLIPPNDPNTTPPSDQRED